MKTGDRIMVQTLALTKRYQSGTAEKTALRRVNLAIPRGEFWIVSGPSGSGKTTLLGLLAGMIAPTEGEVMLDGKSITHLRDHHRALVRQPIALSTPISRRSPGPTPLRRSQARTRNATSAGNNMAPIMPPRVSKVRS